MSLGPAELLVILVVGLLVLGPQKLPDAARQAARGLGQLRRLQATVHDEVMGGFVDDPPASTHSHASTHAPASTHEPEGGSFS
jgi:sec-independent protein translocase protein TatB